MSGTPKKRDSNEDLSSSYQGFGGFVLNGMASYTRSEAYYRVLDLVL